MNNKKVIIIGGGTMSYVRSHFALCAPAFGTVARQLYRIAKKTFDTMDIELVTTVMAGNEHVTANSMVAGEYELPKLNLITNKDVSDFVDELIKDNTTKIIFFPVAMCDWKGEVLDCYNPEINAYHADEDGSGKYGKRLSTRNMNEDCYLMELYPEDKVIGRIRKERKDIHLVGFKQTNGFSEDEQYVAGLNLLKETSCNMVLANDVVTRKNMIIVPEEARYCVTEHRKKVLRQLCSMARDRSNLMFTRSTVVESDLIPWDDPRVPESLRKVVDYCIEQNAYKPFRGSTAGHFAVKLDDQTFLTSVRKTDFNDLAQNGLVLVKTDGPDTVLAYGAKPSVGGQSQRIVFNDHQGLDCIVHFHCPLKENPRDKVPVASQKEYECGSHECGKNTSDHLTQFGNLKCVYLSEHGPNIVFNHKIDPQEVIDFIQANFDLDQKTGGYVTLSDRLSANSTLDTAKEVLS